RTTNPNRPPKGAARTFWQCAFDAATKQKCSEVEKCVFPQAEAWTGSFVGCSKLDPATRIDVRDGGGTFIPAGEACNATGKTCASQAGNFNGLCTGPQGQACVADGCSGTGTSACSDAGVDL